jgi:glycosyltransferase involved in cell wall biosynthesis
VKYFLLGPYPGNSSYSILKYFNFYRNRLGSVLGSEPGALCPGNSLPAIDESFTQTPRLKSWRENYLAWPLELRGLQADMFHIVDQGLFWYGRFLRSGRRLGTVHDLIAYLISSGSLDFAAPSLKRNVLVRENTRQLRQMDHLISVSQFTADCLMRELGVSAARITVVPNHVDERFAPSGEAESAESRRKWFGDAEHAVIHVGRPLPYKNRLGAIQAFALLLQRLPGARMFLINGACTENERTFIEGGPHSAAIRFIPAVTADELRGIYGAADALIFPSFYEGFGWPPLEAMACGCPVVSSTRASLREVVGDAALTVEDPNDHRRLADLLFELLTSRSTASDFRERGLARARLFTAERALGDVAGVYRMLA